MIRLGWLKHRNIPFEVPDEPLMYMRSVGYVGEPENASTFFRWFYNKVAESDRRLVVYYESESSTVKGDWDWAYQHPTFYTDVFGIEALRKTLSELTESGNVRGYNPFMDEPDFKDIDVVDTYAVTVLSPAETRLWRSTYVYKSSLMQFIRPVSFALSGSYLLRKDSEVLISGFDALFIEPFDMPSASLVRLAPRVPFVLPNQLQAGEYLLYYFGQWDVLVTEP